ncbi:MAG TPA: PAS domain S-box protein [Opitutaceae bacterium]|nr:PAS domain S-box protein [Opitutaceae bacterium]
MERMRSEARGSEAAICERDELIAKTFQMTGDCVSLVRLPERTVLRANDALCRFWGTTASEVVNRQTKEFWGWADDSQREAFMRVLTERGECLNWKAELVLAKGRHVEFEVSSFIVTFGGDRCVLSVMRDRTDKNRVEEAEARLAAIVQSSQDGIIGKDLDGIVTSWNAGASSILGYTAEEMIGRSILRLIPQDRRHEEIEILTRVRSGEGVSHFDTQRVRKDGALVDVSVTSSPIRDSSGKIVGASKIVRDITDRKRTEQAMEMSERQFRTMANSMPQLVWVARADGLIEWYNQRWYEYTGTSEEQMEGWGWQAVHDPKVLPRVIENWKAAIELRKPFEMKFPLRGADGRFRMFLTRVHPEIDGMGRVVQWFGTNTDVEELTQMEQSLRSTQAKLGSTLSAGSIGTWTWDIADDRLVADEFTARAFGISTADAAKGLPAVAYLKSVHEDDQASVAEKLALAIEACGTYDIEYRVKRPDGGLVWIQARGRVEADEKGKAASFHGAVMDITARKKAEEDVLLLNADLERRVVDRTAELEKANTELTRSRSVFVNLFESLPGLYLVLTPELVIVTASDAYTKATMTSREAIVGRVLFDIFPDNPDDPAASGVSNLRASLSRVRETLSADAMTIQKYDVRRPDGQFEEHYWSPINSPVLSADRRLEYIVHRVENVTEFVLQKKRDPAKNEAIDARMEQMAAEIFQGSVRVQAANAQLEAANKELEAFSYTVSHDLRAPLRAVDGFSEIMMEDYGPQLPEEGRRLLRVVRSSAQRMGQLVDDLLSFSRLGRQSLKMQPVSIETVVRASLEELKSMREGRQVEVTVGELPPALGDAPLLRQVWLNLISNALKYTGRRERAEIEISSEKKNGEVVYHVRDNGTGFDMKYSHKLFGVFQRLHRAEDYEGTGVGLATVQRIIQRHGGRVWAEAAPDRGATFYFTLAAGPKG